MSAPAAPTAADDRLDEQPVFGQTGDPDGTAAEIQALYLSLPLDRRDALLRRLHDLRATPPDYPRMTPEQVAEVARRSEAVERGEAVFVSEEETRRRSREIIDHYHRLQEGGDAAGPAAAPPREYADAA